MLTRLRSLIRQYFSFSSKETNGFIVLVFLLIVIVLTPSLIKQYLLMNRGTVNNKELMDRWKKEVQSLIIKAPSVESRGRARLDPFLFDPNTLSLQGFDSMGLNPRLASTILNYREKGGRFRVKSDLKKIYGLRESVFDQLYDFIDLPETIVRVNRNERTKPSIVKAQPQENIVLIDINTANANDLQEIKGIGNVLSTRIVSFRNALGGFYSMGQLGEVYGLNDTVVGEVKTRFFVEEDFTPTKIELSSASEQTLKGHPYIDYKMARIISSFCQQHQIQDVNDLMEIKILTDSLFNKIAPYFYVSLSQDSIE